MSRLKSWVIKSLKKLIADAIYNDPRYESNKNRINGIHNLIEQDVIPKIKRAGSPRIIKKKE